MRVLMIFIDGFGLGEADFHKNPYIAAKTPFLDSTLGGKKLTAHLKKEAGANYFLYPTDATLGVKGIPQSATGQTALWTGVNAAERLGKHLNGFPNSILREIIEENNIFSRLIDCGKKVAFANVYRPEFFEKYINRKAFHSVSTTAALAAGLKLKTIEDLTRGQGVYQEMTNRLLVEKLKYNVPIIDPARAGSVLADISSRLDFTLYEFFQTDIAGHKQDKNFSVKLFEKIDSFLEAVLKNVDLRDTLVILISDHGNIEDVSQSSHTNNRVPTLIFSKKENLMGQINVHSLTDVYNFTIQKICNLEEE